MSGNKELSSPLGDTIFVPLATEVEGRGPINYLLVPVGAAVPFFGSTVPEGFLLANGAAISRTTYARLFAVYGTVWGSGDNSTTFNLPDTRGVTLRGFDLGRGLDSGRAFGTYQSDAFQNHGHQVDGTVYYNWSGALEEAHGPPDYTYITRSTTGAIVEISGYGAPRYAVETRMKNITCNYIIRY